MPAETVLLNGRFTTLDPALPEVTAVAIAAPAEPMAVGLPR